jgi:hypothetical protein
MERKIKKFELITEIAEIRLPYFKLIRYNKTPEIRNFKRLATELTQFERLYGTAAGKERKKDVWEKTGRETRKGN